MKHANPKSEARNPKQAPNPKSEGECTGDGLKGSCWDLGHWDLIRISDFGFRISTPAVLP
jgi:hypothetical protein